MAANWKDFEIDEIPEWSPIAQNVLLFILGAVLLILSYFFIFNPALVEKTQLIDAEMTLRAEFQNKANKVSSYGDIDEQIELLNEIYHQVSAQLPEERELASLLAGINDTGVSQNLEFEVLRWRPSTTTGWVLQIPIEIQLSGTYQDIGRFVAEIANLPRIVALQNFTLQRSSVNDSALSFSVSAYTYRYVDNL